MTLFIIERHFAEKLGESTEEEAARGMAVSAELGVEWVNTFLSADRTRTYCLYESPNPELLREHARRLGIPADQIIEVTSLN